MNQEKDESIAVFAILLGLTVFTALSGVLDFGRVSAVSLALLIASVKAGLIAYYFMHLKHERALIYGIVLMGIAAILILAVGILPDIALKL